MRSSVGASSLGRVFSGLAAKTCEVKDSRLISKNPRRFTDRVEKRTYAGTHATVSRVTCQDTGLLKLAYLRFELGVSEGVIPGHCWLFLQRSPASAGNGFTL